MILGVSCLLLLFPFGKHKHFGGHNLVLTTTGTITHATNIICNETSLSLKELTHGYLDSHCCLDHFSFSPKDVTLLENAKAIIINGASLENSLKSRINDYKDLIVIDPSQGLETIKDDHGHSNPWIWLSVPNYMIQIKNICSKLSEIFPNEKDKFEKNSEKYLQELEKIFEEWKMKFKKFSGMKVVVLSNEFDYLLNSLELIPVHLLDRHHHDDSLSSKDISHIKSTIEHENCRFYLISNNNFVKYLDQINNSLGTRYVRLNVLKSISSSYIDEMTKNFESLISCCEEVYESKKM